MSAPVATSSEMDRTARQLWVAIIASAAAFALSGALGWLVTGLACIDGTPGWGPLSGAAVRVVLGGIAVAGLLIAGRGVRVGYREWARRAHTDYRDLKDAAGHDRTLFLAIVALLVGVVFLVGILWEGLPSIFLEVCEVVR